MLSNKAKMNKGSFDGKRVGKRCRKAKTVFVALKGGGRVKIVKDV